MPNTLCVSDLHCPWQHPDACDFLRDLKRKYRPSRVVFMGDEIDSAAWSRFPKNPHLPSPSEELRLARLALKPFFKLFPVASVCVSNHTVRPFLRASEVGLPDALLRSIGEVLEAPPGWTWHERVEIDDVLFVHGEGFSGQGAAVKAAVAHRRKTVIGHIHAWGGVTHLTGWLDRIWALNCGSLIDPTAAAFGYGRHLANRPTLGTGVIVEGVPQFVPMG